MKIAIQREPALVVVDGDARPVANNLASFIEVVVWDTNLQRGQIQYTEDTTIEINERDLAAEEARNRELLAMNQPISEEVLFRKVVVSRPPDPIFDFTPYEDLYVAWQNYTPPPEDPALVAARQKVLTEDTATRSETFGTATVLTTDQIKAMTRAEARTWFDANFNTTADFKRLLRWMFLFIVRRVL